MTREPVRIAVRVADAAVPRWIARLLEGIAASSGLECCGLLVRGHSQAKPPMAWPVRAWLTLEAMIAAHSETPRPYLSDIAEASDDGATLVALRPDVILDLTGARGSGIDARLARYGVWFADCVDEEPGLAGLRSLVRREPINPLSLFRLTGDGDKPRTIAGGAVNPKYLATRNELFLQEKSVTLILRELRRLALTGQVGDEPQPAFEPFARPSLGEFASYVAVAVRESVRRCIEKLQARFGWRPGMFEISGLHGELPGFDPATASTHAPAGGVYHADPFIWHRDGQAYCFFETFDYRRGKGHISVGRWTGGRLAEIRTAVRPEYHVSFPFLFEHAGALFMMPESCATKRIEIWRCTEFPDRWELHATAMEGVVAADSSLAEIDGQWWLFANVSTDPFGDLNSELHLFQVDGPELRTVTPHPLNPVTFDARYARNGGRVMRHGGMLFRPAQENSHGTYGYGLNLMRIEALSMETYSEGLVRRIRPDFRPGLIGCHHLDVREGLIVFDARHRLGGRSGRATRVRLPA
jgi:hypothetical protein